MAISRSKVATGALAIALLAAGLPALGQQQQKTPESILPPGFNEPPTPTPAPTSPPPSAPSILPNRPAPSELPSPSDDALGNVSDAAADADAAQSALDAATAARVDMPAFARRSLAVTGIVGPEQGGMAEDAFGRADGTYLTRLMGRLDAPIASRWLSIGLRRTLASRLRTPAGLNGADFVAERAWLLVRMGESVVARAVAQSVDNGNYTPKLYEAALQASLATGDPAGLCPLVDGARGVASDRAWVLAGAFCAGLGGDPNQSGSLIAAARRSGAATGIDMMLAEKLAGAGAQGRQAVTIEWDGVDQLTAWRYGLAMATGVTIPEPLFATVNPRVLLWRAQAPMLEAGARVPFAERAAAQGVFSNAAIVDLYGEIDDDGDANSAAAATARDLRTAYVDPSPETRLTTLRQLWDEAKTPADRYGRLVLTARAAADLPVAAGGAESDRLIAAMLSAGLEAPALRWANATQRGSDGWAMLQLVMPNAPKLTAADISAYQSRASDPTRRKSAMLFAALAGLGRMTPDAVAPVARTLGIDTALDNAWTRAIDRAAAERQPATVMLLAGIGMQTTDWRGVPPAGFYRIIAAMHRVGLDGIAQMMAVEALTRL